VLATGEDPRAAAVMGWEVMLGPAETSAEETAAGRRSGRRRAVVLVVGVVVGALLLAVPWVGKKVEGAVVWLGSWSGRGRGKAWKGRRVARALAAGEEWSESAGESVGDSIPLLTTSLVGPLPLEGVER